MTEAQIIELAKKCNADLTTFDGEPLSYTFAIANLIKFAELTKARAIPDGYVLVPIEPSEAMLKAAQLEQGDHGSYSDWVDFGDAHDVEATYTAMINAQQERN